MSLPCHHFRVNRTDRLYALREELRRAGPIGRTAERLAGTFEVSVRTIKRDVSTLQQGGFPVWARPGPGGGYVVDDAATLPPINFTDAEISGLAAAVAAHRGQPFDGHARSALVKALSVMDPQARRRATVLKERVWIDHTGTPSDARTRHVVEQALHLQRVLVVHYRDRQEKRTTRLVDPVLLARSQGHWYLVGHCRTRKAIRWFRLDRVTTAHLTSETASSIPVDAVGAPPATAAAVTDP
jgi:predicted DNA-binding transcriptional regulator YafY